MGPDLARPGALLVHCAGAMCLGFGAVVFATTTEAAADSTAAARRVTCCVVITPPACGGWSGSAEQPVAAPLGAGLRRWQRQAKQPTG